MLETTIYRGLFLGKYWSCRVENTLSRGLLGAFISYYWMWNSFVFRYRPKGLLVAQMCNISTTLWDRRVKTSFGTLLALLFSVPLVRSL